MKTEFWKSGIYFPIPVLEPTELATFRDVFFAHEQLLGGNPEIKELAQLHLHFPWAYQLATHPRVLAAVQEILGPDLLIHGSTVFQKRPQDQKFVSWHQDSYKMGLKSNDFVSAWIALADSTVDNGCLRVIPETHDQEYPHEQIPEKNNILTKGLTVDISGKADQSLDVELKAGEMSLHHVHLIHGSNANTSGERRIGYVIRYISPRASQSSYHHKVMVASGKYEGQAYEVERTIPSGTLEECIAKQKLAHTAYARKMGWLEPEKKG